MQGSRVRILSPVIDYHFIYLICVFHCVCPLLLTLLQIFFYYLYRYWQYLESIHEHVIFMIQCVYFNNTFLLALHQLIQTLIFLLHNSTSCSRDNQLQTCVIDYRNWRGQTNQSLIIINQLHLLLNFPPAHVPYSAMNAL